MPLSDRLLSCTPADVLTPEDALIAAEEPPSAVPISASRRTARMQARVRAALDRIPPGEAQCVRLSMAGVTHEDIAIEVGVSSTGTVRYRITRGIERLRWLLGPGALFAAADVPRVLAPRIGTPDARMLAVLWETTSLAEAARVAGEPWQRVGERFEVLVDATLPAVASVARECRPFARGFRELRSWGMRLLCAGPSAEMVMLGTNGRSV